LFTRPVYSPARPWGLAGRVVAPLLELAKQGPGEVRILS
jgi:hypothetical protein